MQCRATQDGQVMVENSDKTWSTGEGNGNSLQYSCLENPMNSMKCQKDMTLHHWLSQKFLFSHSVMSNPTLCNPMYCSTPGFPVLHYLLEFPQTRVHQVSDAIQPSHPLLSHSLPALNLSQHQGLF